MKKYSLRMKGPLELSDGRMTGHRKALLPMKISSGTLPGFNDNLSLKIVSFSLAVKLILKASLHDHTIVREHHPTFV